MKERQSGFELLRIIAMIMVMVLHADFAAFGYPKPPQVEAAPLSWFGMIMTEGFALCAVNVFVLITGWFGTHFRTASFLKLLSQLFFVGLFAIVGLRLATGDWPADLLAALQSFYGYWFINSYLLLYLFSPVLNAYVERTSEPDFRRHLFLVWSFVIPASFFLDDLKYGYTALYFLLLYLTGRYLRLYLSKRLNRVPRSAFLFGYVLSSAIPAVLFFIGLRRFSICAGPLIANYASPFLVVAAACLILYFSRLDFRSRIVNLLAAGSFSAYLLHQQIYLRPYYFRLFRDLDEAYSTPLFLLLSALSIAAIYLTACLIEYGRLLLERGLLRFTRRPR